MRRSLGNAQLLRLARLKKAWKNRDRVSAEEEDKNGFRYVLKRKIIVVGEQQSHHHTQNHGLRVDHGPAEARSWSSNRHFQEKETSNHEFAVYQRSKKVTKPQKCQGREQGPSLHHGRGLAAPSAGCGMGHAALEAGSRLRTAQRRRNRFHTSNRTSTIISHLGRDPWSSTGALLELCNISRGRAGGDRPSTAPAAAIRRVRVGRVGRQPGEPLPKGVQTPRKHSWLRNICEVSTGRT